MTYMVWLKATVVWAIILVLAIANGTLRERTLLACFGTFYAFVTSGVLLSICIFTIAFIAAPWYGSLSSEQWWLIGLFWLFLTLLFEFGFGYFIQQKSWIELLHAYTFERGNIWPVVLIVTTVSPWVVAKFRGLM